MNKNQQIIIFFYPQEEKRLENAEGQLKIWSAQKTRWDQ